MRSPLNATLIPFLLWPILGHAYGPPRLRLAGSDFREVAGVGSEVTLACPVRADPSTLFLEWFRGREPLSGVRKYRLTPQGALRIRKVTLDDAGLYTCRAVNGFGSVEIHVTLVVIGQRETYQIANATSDPLSPSPSSIPGAAPRLTLVTSPFNGSVVQRSAGATVKLKCAGSGEPTPQVTWLKNGQPLPSSNGSSTSPSVKQQRWSLQLENLKTSDAGNYTCVLRNTYGSASASYLLEVVDGTKPEVTGSHPLNTTVEFGSSATFQCRVRSEIPPHIRWLKRVDPGEAEESARTGSGKQRIIRVQGELFRFLKSSQVVSRPDGSFLNKLVIREATDQDSGKYICLGANSLGYSYRSAHLTVLRRHHSAGLMDWERAVILRPGQPDALMIGIPVTVGVLVGVVVTLAILCHSRTRSGAAPSAPIVGGEPVLLRSVEQQTSFSSFPAFSSSPSRSGTPDHRFQVADHRFQGAVFVPDPRAFHHSELVYQERSVVTRLHECPAKDQYDCFFLRDNV